MKSRCLAVATTVLSFSFLVVGGRAGTAPSAPSVRHDAKGLEAEYQPFLDAFNKGKTPPLDKEFSALAVPDPDAWFGDFFQKDSVSSLVHDYSAELAAEQRSLILGMTKQWPAGTHFKVHCKFHPVSPVGFPPRTDAYQPTKPVPIEQFEVEFEANKIGIAGGLSMSTLINTVWVDGAYRFLGGGAYPFWSMPDTTAHKRAQ